MRFELIIDPHSEEQITVTVHEESELTEKIRAMVFEEGAADFLTAYTEGEVKRLSISDIECIFVLDGKSFVTDKNGEQFRIRERLCEIEARLPSYFIRINKSAIANEKRLERFCATLGGGVDALFESGTKEYVSRRCFAEIKRRLLKK